MPCLPCPQHIKIIDFKTFRMPDLKSTNMVKILDCSVEIYGIAEAILSLSANSHPGKGAAWQHLNAWYRFDTVMLIQDSRNFGNPDFRKFRKSRLSGDPECRIFRNSDFRKSRTSGNPESRRSGSAEIPIFGNSDLTGNPDFRNFRKPGFSGNLDFRKFGNPNIRNPGYPEFLISKILEPVSK